MSLQLAPGTVWSDVLDRAAAAVPEAFAGRDPRNLLAGAWSDAGAPTPVRTPVDGSILTRLPRLDADAARVAVADAAARHREWAATPLAVRKERVTSAVDALAAHRDLLALLLVWASRGASPAPTSTAAWTASAGTSARSTARRPAGNRWTARSATSRAGTIR